MCESSQSSGNGPPHPPVSWPESLLSAGDERQSGAQGEIASWETRAAPEPWQAALVRSTVLHVPSAPRTALEPTSLSKCPQPHGRRVLARHFTAVTVPATCLSLAWCVLSQLRVSPRYCCPWQGTRIPCINPRGPLLI